MGIFTYIAGKLGLSSPTPSEEFSGHRPPREQDHNDSKRVDEVRGAALTTLINPLDTYSTPAKKRDRPATSESAVLQFNRTTAAVLYLSHKVRLANCSPLDTLGNTSTAATTTQSANSNNTNMDEAKKAQDDFEKMHDVYAACNSYHENFRQNMAAAKGHVGLLDDALAGLHRAAAEANEAKARIIAKYGSYDTGLITTAKVPSSKTPVDSEPPYKGSHCEAYARTQARVLKANAASLARVCCAQQECSRTEQKDCCRTEQKDCCRQASTATGATVSRCEQFAKTQAKVLMYNKCACGEDENESFGGCREEECCHRGDFGGASSLALFEITQARTLARSYREKRPTQEQYGSHKTRRLNEDGHGSASKDLTPCAHYNLTRAMFP